MFEAAFEAAKAAVAAENAKEYRQAFDSYSKAVQLFLRDLPRLPDEQARIFMRQKCQELMAKAEKMFLFASNRHTTQEGFETRLKLLDGPPPDPTDFRRRLDALYGPKPVLAQLHSEQYDRMQQALQGKYPSDGDIGGGDAIESDDEANMLLQGTVSEIRADLADQLRKMNAEQVNDDEEDTGGNNQKLQATAAEYVRKFGEKSGKKCGDAAVSRGHGGGGAYAARLHSYHGNNDEDDDPDNISDSDIAAAIDEAKFSMLIPEAPTVSPARQISALHASEGAPASDAVENVETKAASTTANKSSDSTADEALIQNLLAQDQKRRQRRENRSVNKRSGGRSLSGSSSGDDTSNEESTESSDGSHDSDDDDFADGRFQSRASLAVQRRVAKARRKMEKLKKYRGRT
eukprot:INCI12209.1.p1 GENE.INCI12209.1~~INCI12209.1.p1  ORF type:complete len:404 (+),score=100.75 INCI12209.1:163-1374(+)